MSLVTLRQSIVDWLETTVTLLAEVQPYGGRVDAEEILNVSVKTPAALVSVMTVDEDEEDSEDGSIGVVIYILGKDLTAPKRSRDEVALAIVSELHRLLPDADFGYSYTRRGPHSITSRNLYDLKSQKNNTIIWGVRFTCTAKMIPVDDSLLDDLNRVYYDATGSVDVMAIEADPTPPVPVINGPTAWSNYVANADSNRHGVCYGYNPDTGKLHFGGGKYGTTKSNETDILDLETGLWASGPVWTTYAHYGASVMARDADGVMKLFVWGGAGSSGSNMIGVSPRSIVWNTITGAISNLPSHTGYYLGAACWDGADTIWLIGGNIYGAGAQTFVWTYTISTGVLDTISKTQLPYGIYSAAAHYSAGKIILAGGSTDTSVTPITMIYDTANDAAGWVDIGKPMPVAVFGATYFPYFGQLMVVGGYDGVYRDTTQRFDPDGLEWHVDASLLLPRLRGGGCTHNGLPYVAYGTTNGTLMNSYVEVGTVP